MSLLLGEDYAQIHKTLLGTKDAQQLRNRSKNQRNSKNQRMNIHKRYFSIYSEFKKWDPSVYTRICQLVLTHGTSECLDFMRSDKLASTSTVIFLFL